VRGERARKGRRKRNARFFQVLPLLQPHHLDRFLTLHLPLEVEAEQAVLAEEPLVVDAPRFLFPVGVARSLLRPRGPGVAPV
jgi:hypothetical protein